MSEIGVIHEIGDYGVFKELDEKQKEVYNEQQQQANKDDSKSGEK